MKLVSIAEKLMAQINQPFYHESSGGGSDGNFTGASLVFQRLMASALKEAIITRWMSILKLVVWLCEVSFWPVF